MEGFCISDQSPCVPLPHHQVFKKAYIPRTLTEVSHYERDVDLMRAKEAETDVGGHRDNVRTASDLVPFHVLARTDKSGRKRLNSPVTCVMSVPPVKISRDAVLQVLYQTLTGMKQDLSGVQTVRSPPPRPNPHFLFVSIQ